MGKLIIDKVTGTVLNIEGCYVIDADQLDDSFTDSEIADLADRVGKPVAMDAEMTEQEAIQLTYKMFAKFEWVGCIFTKEDIRMRLEDEDLSEEQMEPMVEAVTWTRWWRKAMEEAMNETGYELLNSAIYEAKTGETE
jgi:hypothetical protein